MRTFEEPLVLLSPKGVAGVFYAGESVAPVPVLLDWGARVHRAALREVHAATLRRVHAARTREVDGD